jgi:hypothetical protein
MRKSAIVVTSIAVVLSLFSMAVPSEGASEAGSAASCMNWVPTVSVQLAVASLSASDAPVSPDLAPHPDADKCPCKGTGVITHGDGHTTECPYHGEE